MNPNPNPNPSPHPHPNPNPRLAFHGKFDRACRKYIKVLGTSMYQVQSHLVCVDDHLISPVLHPAVRRSEEDR